MEVRKTRQSLQLHKQHCLLSTYVVLTAEIVHHFLPQLIELHNYSPANASPQKIENWRTLNSKFTHCHTPYTLKHLCPHTGKVFPKLNFSLPDDIIQSVAASKAGVVEFILTTLRVKVYKSSKTS